MQRIVDDSVTASAEQLRWSEATRRFNARVTRRLRRLARRVRLLTALRGASLLTAAVVGLAGFHLLADRTLRLDRDMRLALLLVLVAVLGAAAYRFFIRPLWVRIGPGEAALVIERRFPQLRDRLVSAFQFSTRSGGSSAGLAPYSPAMLRQVLSSAESAVAELRIGNTIDYRRVARSVAAGLAALLVAAAAVAAAPGTMSLWLRRNLLLRDEPWPQLTHLLVEGLANGELLHPRGDDLKIEAAVPPGDRVPRVVTIDYEFADGQGGAEPMGKVGQRRFVAGFPRLRRPMRFRLSGGDERTAWYRVRLLDRPRVESLHVELHPPAYTKLPPRSLKENVTLVSALPGTTVTLRIATNVPLERAILVSGDEPASTSTKLADGRWEAVATPIEDAKLHFDLLAENGLKNLRPLQITVRMLTDDPPTVSLALPGVGEMITPTAVLPVELDFTDEYGLATAVLVAEAEPDDEAARELPLDPFEPGTQRFRHEMELAADSLGLTPGRRVTLYGKASDFDGVSGPNVGRSLSATLRVVSPAELTAELARREQEYRHELERLIKTQERIRADLLTRVAAGEDADTAADRTLAQLERQQKHVAGRAAGLGSQVMQILHEMEINRVLEAAARRRLDDGVARPLADLARRRMPAAAEMIAALGGASAARDAQAIDSELADIVAEMRRIAANMVKWEGFQEAVTLLRDILELQGEVHDETGEALERKLREAFGTEP